MFYLVLSSLLMYGSAFYLSPYRVVNKNFNNEIIKIYEPFDTENRNNVLFFTGANSIIPGEVYNSFMSNLAQQNITSYVCTSNIETCDQIAKSIKEENTVVVSHSTGCINAFELCNHNDNIKKLVLLDPVDNSYIYNKKYSVFPDKIKKSVADKIVDGLKNIPLLSGLTIDNEIEEISTELRLKHIENLLFLNAQKSYTWDLFNNKFPFIPAFAITKDKIQYEKDVKAITITANDFGHTDILDEIWANNMHKTVSKGCENRSSENLLLYHKWLATVINIFINNEDFDSVLNSDEIVKQIKNRCE